MGFQSHTSSGKPEHPFNELQTEAASTQTALNIQIQFTIRTNTKGQKHEKHSSEEKVKHQQIANGQSANGGNS